MKKALRILLALVVATTIIGGAFAGNVAAQDQTNAISDNDAFDVQANALNPTTATSVSLLNAGSGNDAVAIAKSDQNAGDQYNQINVDD